MSKFHRYLYKHVTSFRAIILGFLAVILAGTVLLMLPASSVSRQPTPFIDALFTSVSATCVTGLAVHDTATYWSGFGRWVILFLIQVGGLGVMTIVLVLYSLTGREIGIIQRGFLQDSLSARKPAGVLNLGVFVMKVTLLFETAGALLLARTFVPEYGLARGVEYSVFHSISAFCNAGFDLFGIKGQYSSLAFYAGNINVNVTVMLLIISGGLGFITWQDLIDRKFRFHQLSLQSKIILCSATVLIVFPALLLFCLEFTDLPLKERVLASLFQAVTPRTAGFATADYGHLSEITLLLTIVLMLIGGAPGSTAGGMKTTTVFVISASVMSSLHQKEDACCFGRRIEDKTIRDAYALLAVYITLLMFGTAAVAYAEDIPVINAAFECASALGTVGLSTGITPSLSVFSKCLLAGFMYFGRVGGLTLAYAAASRMVWVAKKYPAEKIVVG